MQPSPIQLKEMAYLGIKVWPEPPDETEGADDQTKAPFDFNGVMIGERVETSIFGDVNDPVLFGIKLRIAIENKEGKLAPYALDVEAAGLFEISKKIQKEKREEMVMVNGCAVLYSAIRDQVMTLSARCSRGTFILPTVNFLDKVKKKTDIQQDGQ